MSAPIGMSAAKLITSPIHFYRDRLIDPPRWGSPVAALACYGAILFVSEYVFTARALNTFNPEALAIIIAMAVVMLYLVIAIQAGVVIAIEILFSNARNGRRLIEFSALAYWTQVPIEVVSIGIWLVVEPGQPVSPADSSLWALIEALDSVNEEARESLIISTFQVIGSYWSLWVVALQATALRVVSKFSVGGAWAAGVTVGLLFVVLPWAFV